MYYTQCQIRDKLSAIYKTHHHHAEMFVRLVDRSLMQLGKAQGRCLMEPDFEDDERVVKIICKTRQHHPELLHVLCDELCDMGLDVGSTFPSPFFLQLPAPQLLHASRLSQVRCSPLIYPPCFQVLKFPAEMQNMTR